jgi:exonuclease VII small subunit
MMSKNKTDINNILKELEEINTWFDKEDLDIQEALQKVTEAKTKIKQAKEYLKEVENTFIEIKEDLN